MKKRYPLAKGADDACTVIINGKKARELRRGALKLPDKRLHNAVTNYPILHRDTNDFTGAEPKLFLHNWVELSEIVLGRPNSFQVETLRHGLNVNAYLMPGGIRAEWLAKASSTTKFPNFVTEGIQTWLKQKVIVEITREEAMNGVINPLTVAVDDSDTPKPKRLCLHTLRCNDKTHKKLPMTLPAVTEVAGLTDETVLMVKCDLKSGFLHIPLLPSSMKLFHLHWQGKFYKFIVMPWGTSFATAVFQRFQALILAHLQQLKLIAFNYIDDLLVVFRPDSGWKPQAVITYVMDLFLALGYFVSPGKCSTEPLPRLVFLGIGIDVVKKEFYLTEEKREKLQSLARNIVQRKNVTVKQLQKWAGYVNSLSIVMPKAISWLGPVFNSLKGMSESDKIAPPPELVEVISRWQWAINLPTVMSWLPQTKTSLNWWVHKEGEKFWAQTDDGENITQPQNFRGFLEVLQNSVHRETTYLHLFTKVQAVADITDPKQRGDDVMGYKIMLLENVKTKVTFHMQGEDRWEEGLTPEAASMLKYAYKDKITIDLMASSFNNYE